MEEKDFSIKESLIFAAKSFINHFWLFVEIGLFAALVSTILLLWGLFFFPKFFGSIGLLIISTFVLPYHSEKTPSLLKEVWGKLVTIHYSPQLVLFIVALFLLWVFISTLIMLGQTKILLNIYDNKRVHFSLIFSQFHLLFRGFVASLLYLFIVLIGFIFFLIPGMIFMVRFAFVYQYLVDTQCSVYEAFARSWNLTRHLTYKLVGTYGVLALITMFILKSTTFALLFDDFVFTYIYRTLQKQTGELSKKSH